MTSTASAPPTPTCGKRPGGGGQCRPSRWRPRQLGPPALLQAPPAPPLTPPPRACCKGQRPAPPGPSQRLGLSITPKALATGWALGGRSRLAQPLCPQQMITAAATAPQGLRHSPRTCPGRRRWGCGCPCRSSCRRGRRSSPAQSAAAAVPVWAPGMGARPAPGITSRTALAHPPQQLPWQQAAQRSKRLAPAAGASCLEAAGWHGMPHTSSSFRQPAHPSWTPPPPRACPLPCKPPPPPPSAPPGG